MSIVGASLSAHRVMALSRRAHQCFLQLFSPYITVVLPLSRPQSALASFHSLSVTLPAFARRSLLLFSPYVVVVLRLSSAVCACLLSRSLCSLASLSSAVCTCLLSRSLCSLSCLCSAVSAALRSRLLSHCRRSRSYLSSSVSAALQT